MNTYPQSAPESDAHDRGSEDQEPPPCGEPVPSLDGEPSGNDYDDSLSELAMKYAVEHEEQQRREWTAKVRREYFCEVLSSCTEGATYRVIGHQGRLYIYTGDLVQAIQHEVEEARCKVSTGPHAGVLSGCVPFGWSIHLMGVIGRMTDGMICFDTEDLEELRLRIEHARGES